MCQYFLGYEDVNFTRYFSDSFYFLTCVAAILNHFITSIVLALKGNKKCTVGTVDQFAVGNTVLGFGPELERPNTKLLLLK